MKKDCLVKTLALGVVVLFFITTVSSTIGVSNYLDDTTPPVTTISFNPPEPDGLNGWYVSSVTVILNATDDGSGVNITKYRVDGGVWYNYTEPFILVDDGKNILIDFYSIDNAQNVEEVKSDVIDIDKTKPEICFAYELKGWNMIFTATAIDAISGMNRVEFYFNSELQETISGPGPIYQLNINYLISLILRGLILNPEITDEFVKFYAILVFVSGEVNPLCYLHFTRCAVAYDNAGNKKTEYIQDPFFTSNIYPGIYLFKNLTLPSDYTGYIGKFFITAKFDV